MPERFQSTRPREARRVRQVVWSMSSVSIHAPTRGATQSPLVLHRLCCFNPRAHERRDPFRHRSLRWFYSFNPRAHERRDLFSEKTNDSVLFQSTRPREARLLTLSLPLSQLGFNPRAHERRDVGAKKRQQYSKVSIHAPTRGATYLLLLLLTN